MQRWCLFLSLVARSGATADCAGTLQGCNGGNGGNTEASGVHVPQQKFTQPAPPPPVPPPHLQELEAAARQLQSVGSPPLAPGLIPKHQFGTADVLIFVFTFLIVGSIVVAWVILAARKRKKLEKEEQLKKLYGSKGATFGGRDGGAPHRV